MPKNIATKNDQKFSEINQIRSNTRMQEAWELMNFYLENSLALHIGKETLFPDATYALGGGEMPPFNFYIELDNGSERIRSQRDQDSIERKIRLYDQHENGSD